MTRDCGLRIAESETGHKRRVGSTPTSGTISSNNNNQSAVGALPFEFPKGNFFKANADKRGQAGHCPFLVPLAPAAAASSLQAYAP